MRVETRQEQHGAVARLLSEITQHPEKYLNPSDLANFFGYSTNHVNRLFRDFFGEPSLHFVRRLLLERAAFELLHKRHSVADIAYRSQYSQPEAFTKAFRKQYGVSPSLFINQVNPEWKIECHSGIHWGTENEAIPLLQGAEQFGIRLAVREPITVWAIPVIGDFIHIPNVWAKLSHSLPPEVVKDKTWVTVYHSDGLIETGREAMSAHLGFIDESSPSLEGFERITIPGGPFLTSDRMSSAKQHSAAWTFINRHWVPKKVNRLELPGFDSYSTFPLPWSDIQFQIWLGLR